MENKILIDSVNNLKVALNEISVYDFDVYTSMELYYKIAENFNKVIKELNRFEGVVSDEVIKQNEKLLYLLGEGLKIEVVDKINEMVEKGVFDTIINHNIFNNLKNDINNINSQLEHIAKNIEVSVTDFGAKGDGVTDDTQAFLNANKYIWSLAYNVHTPNIVSDRGIKLIIPNGVYKVKGDKILGSIRNECEYPDVKSVYYTIEGNDSTLLWNITGEDARLFYFDYTVNAPNIRDLRIFTINENIVGDEPKTPSNGIIFSIEAVKDTYGNWKASSGNGRYTNIKTCSGRNSLFKGNRCKYVFRVIGENNSDQSLVENCDFSYFKTLFYCENSQAVNWTFIRNGMFGAYTDSIYFKFTRMNDNFNVHMNSFSLHDGQTILECLSDIDSNGKLIERPDYNFSFVDNRMEVYHSGEYDYINVCKMNFGKMYMARSNFKLASGSVNVRQQFLISGHGSYELDSCTLVKPLFTTSSITDKTSGLGNTDYMASNIRNCMYTGSYEVKLCNDGFNIVDITPYLLDNSYVRMMIVSNLRKVNNITLTNFVISKTIRESSQTNQNEWSFYPTKGDLSMGYYIELPPFSTITNIELTNMPVIPANYKTIRVYFGDKTNNNYVDTENINPNITIKTKLTLFDGFASIIDENISNQKIFVCVVDTDGSEVYIGGTIKITVMPLNIKFLGTVSVGIHVRENKTSKETCVGKTSQRPNVPYKGMNWFDTSLNKPIWFDGTKWIDSVGSEV